MRGRAEGADLHAPGATNTQQLLLQKDFSRAEEQHFCTLIAQKHPAPCSGCCHSQVKHSTITTSNILRRHCNHPIAESDPYGDHSAPFCWDFHCSDGHTSLITMARGFPELL